MEGQSRFFDETLTESQIDALNDSPPTRCFAIISWGCAATSWVSKALCSHPELFCVHALNSVWENFGAGPRLDGLQYLRLLAYYGRAYAAAGDIHGVSRQHVPMLRDKLGDKFEAVVLVREPMARLHSQISLFEQCNYRRWGELAYIDDLARAVGIDPQSLTVEQRHFIHGTNMLNAITEEKNVGTIYKSEDVTSNIDILLQLVREISGNSLGPELAWARSTIGLDPVNLHSAKKIDVHIKGHFDIWSQEIIRAVVLPEAWHEYAKLGYETPSFV